VKQKQLFDGPVPMQSSMVILNTLLDFLLPFVDLEKTVNINWTDYKDFSGEKCNN
jgi:hypothetical protein